MKPSSKSVRENEVAFCGDVKSWLDALFAQHPEWPFSHAKIEQYGSGNRKRSDLQIYRAGSITPVLTGEVKMPGTPEGRSPFSDLLMQDAFLKADNVQAPYFFTWNINWFVLFDRSRWNFQLIDRRIKDWKLPYSLTSPGDASRPDVQAYLRDQLLPDIFAQFALIVQGKVIEWGLAPDDLFIRSLESHLEWPVQGTRDYLVASHATDPVFAAHLQSWMADEMNWMFDPTDKTSWWQIIDRAARTLCYVFCNRAIFYEAIRSRYPTDLDPLKMPRRSRRGELGIYDYFRRQFELAVERTGDYEPIFYPHVQDWAGALVFASDLAKEGWEGLFSSLSHYNFRQIPYDIVGGIFQKLISPEERQKFGQFYTNEDIIDVINAFCIRRGGDTVIDPACGSGSFLVRAYHRKAWLSEHAGRRNQDRHKRHDLLLREIFGCDISLFAAHLATLNLASRHIEEEENYPFVARGNFFELLDRRERFCTIPGSLLENGTKEKIQVRLPELDAVVGNPPYVRQELIPKRKNIKQQRGESEHALESRLKNSKEHIQELCTRLWPGLKLSGRSDLHCYFWPVAGSLLKEGAHFGFLTSSSWLDVEYGFALQGWILKNFKLVAVLESLDEPWFEDARVKTAVTILQRCSDENARMSNVTKFVRLLKPITEILGDRSPGDEAARQMAAENLRKLILKTSVPLSTPSLRIMPVPQSQLWAEGVKAATLLKNVPEIDEDSEDSDGIAREARTLYEARSQYGAGKWGRFLRAPDLYFRLLERFGNRFVRLGEIADVRFGIKSGCDAFFMPRDVTDQIRRSIEDGLPWNDVGLYTPCKRNEIQSGKVRVIRAGDTTLHPIEAEFLRPEVHSLMAVDRPVIRASDIDRVVLWVGAPLSNLAHTYVAKYIRWGAKQTFESKKSRAVTVPERSTCASRPVWYDLTNAGTGTDFWPMAQKYRHIIPTNPERLVCNHNLFYLDTIALGDAERIAFSASLNSTIVALFKHFYGRYAGSEGTLKTEVVDTVLLEIPDPRGVSKRLSNRMRHALEDLASRKTTHLVEDALLNCHSEKDMRVVLQSPPKLPLELTQPDRRELDSCVLELIGLHDTDERERLLDELYLETTLYYRYQRTQDIQTSENRSGKNNGALSAQEVARSIWSQIETDDKGPAVADWISRTFADLCEVVIPEGRAQALGKTDMFQPSTVIFKRGLESDQVHLDNPEQAEFVAALARIGVRDTISIPVSSKACAEAMEQLSTRLTRAEEKFTTQARTMVGDHALQEQIVGLLMRWYIKGAD